MDDERIVGYIDGYPATSEDFIRVCESPHIPHRPQKAVVVLPVLQDKGGFMFGWFGKKKKERKAATPQEAIVALLLHEVNTKPTNFEPGKHASSIKHLPTGFQIYPHRVYDNNAKAVVDTSDWEFEDRVNGPFRPELIVEAYKKHNPATIAALNLLLDKAEEGRRV